MPDRVLVTGATGFVGSHLVRALADLGHKVVAMRRAGSDPRNLPRAPHDLVDADLLDPASLRAAVDGCETVFHCAAVVSFWKKDAEAMRLANVEGTRALVRAARDAKVKRFVHTSSVAAIGHVAGGIADERTSWDFARLRIPYCDTKRAAEQVVLDEGVRHGLDAVIVNPAFVFGPGDRRKARGSWLQRIARRPPFFAPGGGMNAVDVHDVASGHILAAQRGRAGERYILGGENLTHAQLFRKVCRIIGKRPPRVTIPAPLMRMVARAATWLDLVFALRPPATAEILRMLPLRLFYSSEKAATELGYASFPIDMAIKATFDWMLDMDLLPAGIVRGLGRV